MEVCSWQSYLITCPVFKKKRRRRTLEQSDLKVQFWPLLKNQRGFLHRVHCLDLDWGVFCQFTMVPSPSLKAFFLSLHFSSPKQGDSWGAQYVTGPSGCCLWVQSHHMSHKNPKQNRFLLQSTKAKHRFYWRSFGNNVGKWHHTSLSKTSRVCQSLHYIHRFSLLWNSPIPPPPSTRDSYLERWVGRGLTLQRWEGESIFLQIFGTTERWLQMLSLDTGVSAMFFFSPK